MIAFGITLLLSITFLSAVAVLFPSLRQAWRIYGELSRALSLCQDERLVTVHLTETARRAPQPRRHARGAVRPIIQPMRLGALRVAA